MKKIVIVLLLISVLATPCFALNIIDMVLYKKVVLDINHMALLVNRVTGQVKYIKLNNGKWALLKGSIRDQWQSLYDAQVASK